MDDGKRTEEAAQWLVRLEHEATPDCQTEFKSWLERSPLNMEEFLLVTAAYKELDGLDAARRIDVEAYIRELAAERAPNIVALQTKEKKNLSLSRTESSVKDSLFSWRLAAGIAAIGLVLALAWWAAPFLTGTRAYATAIGEQRAIKLGEGSVIQLNTQSRVEVRLSDHAREIRLLQGEALFAVEHDPARPFRVITDTAVIQAIGTQFNVYRRDGATTVAVVQGAVRVSADGTQHLVAGEEATVLSTGRIVAKRGAAEVERAVAWRERKLDFRATSLADVAAEFNRYNRTQIRVVDPSIRARELNGVFNADEPQSLLEFLAQDENLAFEKNGEEIVIRRKGPDAEPRRVMPRTP